MSPPYSHAQALTFAFTKLSGRAKQVSWADGPAPSGYVELIRSHVSSARFPKFPGVNPTFSTGHIKCLSPAVGGLK